PLMFGHQAADGVDEGRLAGTVGPDQADDLTSLDLDRDILQSAEPVEHRSDADRLEGVAVGIGAGHDRIGTLLSGPGKEAAQPVVDLPAPEQTGWPPQHETEHRSPEEQVGQV